MRGPDVTDRERWNDRYRKRGPELPKPSSLLTSLVDLLPNTGRFIDVAGGSGRHAIWLAQHGLDATLADVSDTALEMAQRSANQQGVTLHTLNVDLEQASFPAGPWDVILCFHYLHRPLFPAFARELADDGVLVFVQPTITNLERHERPSARFLLEDGEAPRLVNGLDILSYDEGWLDGSRHEARIVARKPA